MLISRGMIYFGGKEKGAPLGNECEREDPKRIKYLVMLNVSGVFALVKQRGS